MNDIPMSSLTRVVTEKLKNKKKNCYVNTISQVERITG